MSHQTAPVAVREKVAFGPERLGDALDDLRTNGPAREAAILSSCNRTEIYCRPHRGEPVEVLQWLCRYQGVERRHLAGCVYQRPQEEAVKHAFRVAAGLDSMVVGEPQILGQMKGAFAAAQRAGTTGKILNRLFQQTFSVAKRVRTDTAIGASPVSVARAAIELAQCIFADLTERNALLIGAGDTISLCAHQLNRCGVRRIIAANRSSERAEWLVRDEGHEAIALGEVPNRLAEADIVVASTASPLPILGKGAVVGAPSAFEAATYILSPSPRDSARLAPGISICAMK